MAMMSLSGETYQGSNLLPSSRAAFLEQSSAAQTEAPAAPAAYQIGATHHQDQLLSGKFANNDCGRTASLFECGANAGLADSNKTSGGYLTSAFANPAFQSLSQINDIIDATVNSTKDQYQWLSSFADPRVESWPMMSSPVPVLVAFFLYLIMANYGPSLMKSRKPLQLRWLLVVYNLYVASLNLWIAAELCYCSYKLNYNSLCQLVTVTDDPYVMRIAAGVWWYFASKGIEFADTLFFILRKKDRQLTFLHKYHHSSMFLVWWTAVRFVPGGSAIIPIVVNSLVHVLMYTYYGLSALGPGMQRYLWWKKHLTRVQLIQFFIGVCIGVRLISTGCQFTRWMQYVFSGYAFTFIILFGNFYLNEYIKGRQSSRITSNKPKEL